MSTLEEERKFIEDLILSSGFSLREMSIKIGKKDSYLQQYVKYGRPSKLADKDKEAILKMARGRKRKTDMTPEQAAIESGIGGVGGFGGGFDVKRLVDIERCADKYTDSKDSFSFKILNQNKVPVGRKLGNMTISCPYLPFKKGENYEALFVSYDNMEPLIRVGDVLIYDINVRKFEGDGVYIVFEHMTYLPKLVLGDENGEIYIKDSCGNRKPVKVEKDFVFFGRVVSVLNNNI